MKTNRLHPALCPFLLLAALCASGLGPATARAASLDDPVCKTIVAALEKTQQTSHHAYSTIASAGSQPMENEAIQIDGKMYVKIQNAWKTSPISEKDALNQIKENLRSAKAFTCRHDRDETIDGEAAAVYKTHQDSEDIKSDAEIWISKSRGLILREVVDHPEDHMRITTHYEYNHVTTPVGVQ